jgi:DNA-binding NarL/FixJ family response regulator
VQRALEVARQCDAELAALRERERLARDLHASLGHALVALSVQEVFMQPAIASRLLRELVRPQESPLDALSEREREVLVLLAQGTSNRDLTEKLYITELH